MLNFEVLNSILGRGRALVEEINAFIKKEESTALPLLKLAKRIDDLIGDIKSQLPEPSADESNELKLLISTLGRIAQNFGDIRKILLTPSSHTLFKRNKLNELQPVLKRLNSNLNQLENLLTSHSENKLAMVRLPIPKL